MRPGCDGANRDYRLKKDLTKSLFDGPEDCFEAAVDIKFFENAVQMALDRFLADKKLLGNFFVRGAFHEDAQDFLLPGR